MTVYESQCSKEGCRSASLLDSGYWGDGWIAFWLCDLIDWCGCGGGYVHTKLDLVFTSFVGAPGGQKRTSCAEGRSNPTGYILQS